MQLASVDIFQAASSSQKLFRKRPVILHFHTYKNAGTTVDALLQRCFSEAWANFDGPVEEFFIHHSEIAIIARNRPHLKAISSHQIRLPVPESPTIEFLPIVFIRRPELRVASLWRFEQRRNDDHPRSRIARERGFKEWVADTISGPYAPLICNSQTLLFSFQLNNRTLIGDPNVFDFALENFRKLDFIGVVEKLSECIKVYQRMYGEAIPEFRYEGISARNVTGRIDLSTEEQLKEIAKELGPDLFQALQNKNAHDIALYEIALGKFREVME